jgi:hypothetical protein
MTQDAVESVLSKANRDALQKARLSDAVEWLTAVSMTGSVPLDQPVLEPEDPVTSSLGQRYMIGAGNERAPMRYVGR